MVGPVSHASQWTGPCEKYAPLRDCNPHGWTTHLLGTHIQIKKAGPKATPETWESHEMSIEAKVCKLTAWWPPRGPADIWNGLIEWLHSFYSTDGLRGQIGYMDWLIESASLGGGSYVKKVQMLRLTGVRIQSEMGRQHQQITQWLCKCASWKQMSEGPGCILKTTM